LEVEEFDEIVIESSKFEPQSVFGVENVDIHEGELVGGGWGEDVG
jgi:hypothetical protein